MSKTVPGLFVTGTDTEVGKTYVAAMVARQLAAEGMRVGVYKPAASDCREENGQLISDDAVSLWEAAGRPGELDRVCPQRFRAPLAPHLAAQAEGKRINRRLLLDGIGYWRDRSDVVLAEGAGGLLCPLDDGPFHVCDLAALFELPLVVVAANVLGVINHTLLTLRAAKDAGLAVAAVVLNEPNAQTDPHTRDSNAAELNARCHPVRVARLCQGGGDCTPPIRWRALLEKRTNHRARSRR